MARKAIARGPGALCRLNAGTVGITAHAPPSTRPGPTRTDNQPPTGRTASTAIEECGPMRADRP